MESRYMSEYNVVTTNKKHKGICILFEGVRYQTLSSFAKQYGFDSGGKNNLKMTWYKQQLSKLPLKNCLRFLRSESLTSISRLVPEDLRDGKVDVKDKHEFFIPATRNVNTGNAGLFKSSVFDDDKQHTVLVNVIIFSVT